MDVRGFHKIDLESKSDQDLISFIQQRRQQQHQHQQRYGGTCEMNKENHDHGSLILNHAVAV